MKQLTSTYRRTHGDKQTDDSETVEKQSKIHDGKKDDAREQTIENIFALSMFKKLSSNSNLNVRAFVFVWTILAALNANRLDSFLIDFRLFHLISIKNHQHTASRSTFWHESSLPLAVLVHVDASGLFYQHGSTPIPAWRRNYIHH